MADAIDDIHAAHVHARVEWLSDEINEIADALSQQLPKYMRKDLLKDLAVRQSERRALREVANTL